MEQLDELGRGIGCDFRVEQQQLRVARGRVRNRADVLAAHGVDDVLEPAVRHRQLQRVLEQLDPVDAQPVLAVVVLSFWRKFIQYRACIFAALLIALTYSNYWLIWVCWEEHNFIFPYEGTILYAFFCVFALGITFKLALAANVTNILGFIGLMWVAPVYGDRVLISMAFVLSNFLYSTSSTAYLLKTKNWAFDIGAFAPVPHTTLSTT